MTFHIALYGQWEIKRVKLVDTPESPTVGEPTMPTTSTLDDGAVFVIDVDPTAEWHHSTFPEPLITVDHAADDAVIKIVAVGEAARRLCSAWADPVRWSAQAVCVDLATAGHAQVALWSRGPSRCAL